MIDLLGNWAERCQRSLSVWQCLPPVVPNALVVISNRCFGRFCLAGEHKCNGIQVLLPAPVSDLLQTSLPIVLVARFVF